MPFHPALHTAMGKLDEYYQRTAASDAHLIAMGKSKFTLFFHIYCRTGVALNPAEKFAYFRKHWGLDLYQEVLETIKKLVCDLFLICLFFFTFFQIQFIQQYKLLHSEAGSATHQVTAILG
jgi:hypothetical protein